MLVTLAALVAKSNTGTSVLFGLRRGTTGIGLKIRVHGYQLPGQIRCQSRHYVNGLTAGEVYTFKFAWVVVDTAATVNLYADNVNIGPAVMMVQAA